MRGAIVVMLMAACGPRSVMVMEARAVEMAGPVEERMGVVVRAGELMRDEEPVNGVVISRLPAPHRERAVALTPGTVEGARAMVGRRDSRTAMAFAMEVAAGITGRQSEEMVVEPRGTWTELGAGDIVVFERVEMVAVVMGTDVRGVTDLLYVARGVVRRGYMDLGRPTVARDREGRVVNSFLRHGAEQPPTGTRYLAGELASGRVRIR